MVTENLNQVRENIKAACEAAGRDPKEVTLIAVSKTKPVHMLQEAYDAGARVFGENHGQISAAAKGYPVAYDRTSSEK